VNILFLDQFSDPGGAQLCLLDLLPAVAERGWHAHAGLPGTGPVAGRARECGATVHSITCGPYQSGGKSAGDVVRFMQDSAGTSRQIREIVSTCAIDLIYVNGPRLLPAAAMASRGLPVLFHCHSYLAQPFHRALVSWAVEHAGAVVIGCCRFVLKPLDRKLGPARKRVIYNGVAGPAAPPPHGSGVTVGLIGRITPEKGHTEFVAAAQLLHTTNPAWRFAIFGRSMFSDGQSSQFEAELKARAEGLPVVFHGWCDDVFAALATIDLLVVPSTVPEATPRVILEAQAAGVPVVGVRAGGVPELIDDGETGFLIDAPDPQQLAAKISEVMNSPERVRVAERARSVWVKRFTVQRYREEMIAAIEETVGFEEPDRSAGAKPGRESRQRPPAQRRQREPGGNPGG
jgi:glycosyltransferase involved in cell wall biosynthesis